MGFLYGDLDSNVLVKQGDKITKGQQIGFEGNPEGTTSTGLHVHIEQQDISVHSWSYEWNSGYFINPCLLMSIENKVDYSNSYIYDGSPYTPATEIKKRKYPWAVYIRKIRQRRI